MDEINEMIGTGEKGKKQVQRGKNYQTARAKRLPRHPATYRTFTRPLEQNGILKRKADRL